MSLVCGHISCRTTVRQGFLFIDHSECVEGLRELKISQALYPLAGVLALSFYDALEKIVRHLHLPEFLLAYALFFR
jgi:hypothetical protein